MLDLLVGRYVVSESSWISRIWSARATLVLARSTTTVQANDAGEDAERDMAWPPKGSCFASADQNARRAFAVNYIPVLGMELERGHAKRAPFQ
jgi:hypothetical protein